jgi:hypothetical protein
MKGGGRYLQVHGQRGFHMFVSGGIMNEQRWKVSFIWDIWTRMENVSIFICLKKSRACMNKPQKQITFCQLSRATFGL